MRFIISILVGGIILGFSLWLSIRIVDRDNRSNTLVGDLIIGIILQAILFIPGFIGILIALLVLSWVFNSYDLEIGEAIVVLIILSVIETLIECLSGLFIGIMT